MLLRCSADFELSSLESKKILKTFVMCKCESKSEAWIQCSNMFFYHYRRITHYHVVEDLYTYNAERDIFLQDSPVIPKRTLRYY